jgi:hypothetical protein
MRLDSELNGEFERMATRRISAKNQPWNLPIVRFSFFSKGTMNTENR